jgi:HSP20 family molecular chaperone IbpA
MSSIREQEKFHARQMEGLKRKSERELRSIETLHQNHKADVAKSHESEIVNLRNEHEIKIAAENEKKEKLITQMKDHLDRTKMMTDKELRELKSNTTKIKEQNAANLSDDREVRTSEHQAYVEDLNHRFNESVQKINEDGQDQINLRKEALRDEYNGMEDNFKTKIGRQTEEYTTKFKKDEQDFQRMKDEQVSQNKKQRLEINQKQQIELEKSSRQHAKTTQERDLEFRKEVKNQDLSFEKKYGEHLKKHQDDLLRLDQQKEKVSQGLKTALTDQMVTTSKRSQDSFYRFVDLKPSLAHHPDHVEVQVAVPEHSKQDLQLTTNGKEVIVNFNRRYDDTSRPMKGVVNKMHKVETYTTRLTTDYILNPKTVKSSYQDGIMTFTVKKA